MNARRVTVAIALTVGALTACAGPQNPAAAPATKGVSPADVPRTSWATAPTSAAQTASSNASTAIAHYLTVAHNAFPGEDTATLIADAREICAALREHPSLHDAVGTLASRTGSQATANDIVHAAIAAYCPDSPAR
jgi:hypothetical protein